MAKKQITKATEEERLKAFRKLNKLCSELEVEIRKQVVTINKNLLGRVRGGDKFLHDYCIEVACGIFLSESDRDWRKESDNCLAAFRFHANFYHPYNRDSYWQKLGDKKDHPPRVDWWAYPFNEEKHCYIWSRFMEFWPLIKMDSVGRITADILVTHEHVLGVKNKRLKSEKVKWPEIILKDFL